MSWRTKGQYVGLGQAEIAWLRRFDRGWDKKSSGRSRTDAVDRTISQPASCSARNFDPAPILAVAVIATETNFRTLLEADFMAAVRSIEKFTVPKQSKSGWSIHVVLKTGKRTRVHFDDLDSALHVYEEIAEFSQWFSRT